MFRKGKKIKEPKLSPEESQKLVQSATAQPQYQQQPMIPQQQVFQQPQQQIQYTQKQQPTDKVTDYYITKKDLVREKQTIVTQSNQIIETGQEITKQVARDLHQMTQDDLVVIIQHVPQTKAIHQLALKMLTGNL